MLELIHGYKSKEDTQYQEEYSQVISLDCNRDESLPLKVAKGAEYIHVK